MSNLLSKSVLAAALGLSFGLASHAAETYNYPAQYQAAREKCDSLRDSDLARCIVNIRPTPSAATAAADTGAKESADEEQALKQCEQMSGDSKQHCMDMIKEHKGKM